VSTPPSIVSGSWRIPVLGNSDRMHHVFDIGRLLELCVCQRRPLMIASDLEMVSDATWHVAKALTYAPHWQIIVTYWNTAMQQNNIWSPAFEARTKVIWTEECWSNSPHCRFHTQPGIRFEHHSIKFNPIVLNLQGTT
jgi:hypothetical protein